MATEFNPGTGRRGILERPGVRVFQRFGEVSPTIIRPLLESVQIGECYQIVSQALAGLYDGTSTVFSYPRLLPAAAVVMAETKVFIETIEDSFDITTAAGVVISASSITIPLSLVPTKLLIDHAQAGGITAGTFLEDPNAAFVADNIRPGDTLDFETSAGSLKNLDSVVSVANTSTFTILNVLSDTKLELSPVQVVEAGKFEYSITRTGSSAGNILVDYRALRADLLDTLIEVESPEDIVTQIGAIEPLNPLAFAMSLALQNTINLVAGVCVLNQDSITDHQDALDFLESEEVYAMNPLTQNTSIHQLYEQHVIQMSDPHEKKERIVFINKAILNEEVFQVSSTTGGTDSVNGALFQDASAKFITNNVPVGSIIKLSAGLTGGAEGSFPVGVTELQILKVNSEIEVELISAANTSLAGLTYTVQSKTFTKLQKARNCQDFAESFANRRVISIIPDKADFAVGDTTQSLPGYFLSAMYTGLISGTGPAQGFTNLPVAGATALSNSNKFFSETQLGIMAAGGNFIVIQESLQGPVFSRHQLTTDASAIETRELSIIKSLDYTAKFFRKTLRRMIGVFNITKDFIDNQVRPASEGVLSDLKSENIIGRDTHITAIEQDKTQPDNLNIFIAYEALFPSNFINVILIV